MFTKLSINTCLIFLAEVMISWVDLIGPFPLMKSVMSIIILNNIKSVFFIIDSLASLIDDRSKKSKI